MIRRAGKLEIWRTEGLMVRLDCATPHGARCADSSLVTRNATNHFTSLRDTSDAEFSECTSRIETNSLGIDLQGAASCALGCRCLSLVSACRVQSC